MLICSNTFTCTVTKRNKELNCNTMLIFCKLCPEQYVESAANIKIRFRIYIHKRDTRTKKDLCGIAQNFSNKYCDQHDPNKYLAVNIRGY